MVASRTWLICEDQMVRILETRAAKQATALKAAVSVWAAAAMCFAAVMAAVLSI